MTGRKKDKSAPVGRPSKYDPALAAQICEMIILGCSLRSICERNEMPSKSMVARWLADPKNAVFRDQYARAREAQLDIMADELLDIADDGTNDWVEKQNRDGSTYEAIDHDHINRSRLRIDTRKWLLSKLAPKKYGDKLLVGGDPNQPIKYSMEIVFVKPAPMIEHEAVE